MICENIYECDWLFLTQLPKRYWEETENTDQRRPEEEQDTAGQNQNKSTVKEKSLKRKNGESLEVRVFVIQ